VIKCDRCGMDVSVEQAATVTVFGEPWHYCEECFNRLVVEVQQRGGETSWLKSAPMVHTRS